MGVPRIECHAVLDSTNAEARRRAEAGDFGPVWIHALEQTAGRGRRGRPWRGGGGNLAATLLTPIDRPPAEAAQVSFVAAIAL
ncbi:MAG: biotin--[acetyl-CoA-carboxylase] ligase, partial [Phenylobacterium sp.]